MGYTTYSSVDRSVRAQAAGYDTKPAEEIFSSNFSQEMNPYQVKMREARDSQAHPESVAIIIALDVTGSMGRIPHYLVKEGIVHIVGELLSAGVQHPQVSFMGVGDHKTDNAPLQIGQFESGDELMDKWLTTLWLEGHGGGNGGESYFLPWYFAGKHTAIDCFEKRGQKGILITIGDEPIHQSISARSISRIFGAPESKDYTAKELYDLASEKYHVFHLNVLEGSDGRSSSGSSTWNILQPSNRKDVENHKMVPKMIVDIILGCLNHAAVAENAVTPQKKDEPVEMML